MYCPVSESGSSSSGSGSDRSGADRSNHSDEKHSNANSSKSDNHTDRNSSDDSFKSKRNNHGKVKSDIWEDNPDIYGIRRSARSRKEPDRLKLADSDSSERGKTHSRKSRKRRYCYYKKVLVIKIF